MLAIAQPGPKHIDAMHSLKNFFSCCSPETIPGYGGKDPAFPRIPGVADAGFRLELPGSSPGRR